MEEFRDALLAVTGELESTLGGDSGELDSPQFKRRTIYGKVSRHDLAGVLRLFDFPNPTLSSDLRGETTLPQQMLYVLNSPFVIDRESLGGACFGPMLRTHRCGSSLPVLWAESRCRPSPRLPRSIWHLRIVPKTMRRFN